MQSKMQEITLPGIDFFYFSFFFKVSAIFIQYSTSVKVVIDEEEPMALIYDIGNLKDLSRLVLFDEEIWKF